jgi:hypothetical protein
MISGRGNPHGNRDGQRASFAMAAMRLTFLTTLCMIILYNGFPGAARAGDYPWCVATLEGRTDCSFYTYEQCKATASGIGGCYRNIRTLFPPSTYSGPSGYAPVGSPVTPCSWRNQRFWDGHAWRMRRIRICS